MQINNIALERKLVETQLAELEPAHNQRTLRFSTHSARGDTIVSIIEGFDERKREPRCGQSESCLLLLLLALLFALLRWLMVLLMCSEGVETAIRHLLP